VHTLTPQDPLVNPSTSSQLKVRDFSPNTTLVVAETDKGVRLDWDDSEADLSHILRGTSQGAGGGNGKTEHLWEDNWDDDDVDDDFSKKLRCV
jgi:hypothetical protein